MTNDVNNRDSRSQHDSQGCVWCSVVVICMAFLCSASAGADSVELPWSDNEQGTLIEDVPGADNMHLGYEFTPMVDGTVALLGGKFSGARWVSLWEKTASSPLLLAMTLVNSSNQRAYAPLMWNAQDPQQDAVVLKANTHYFVTVYNPPGDTFRMHIPLADPFPQVYCNVRIEGGAFLNDSIMYTHTNWMLGEADIVFEPSVPTCDGIASPTMQNAANLNVFLGSEGYNFDTNTWTPARGNFTILEPIDGPTITAGLRAERIGHDLYYSARGLLRATGTFPTIPATADALWIMSGRHTSPPVEGNEPGEGPTMTFRLGSGNVPAEPSIRVRTYPLPVGDSINDGLGGMTPLIPEEWPIWAREYSIYSPSVFEADPNHYTIVAALDRSANMWRMRGWRDQELIDSHDNDISGFGFGEFAFKTTDDTANPMESALTINGVVSGYALYVFPDGLPPDWEEAAQAMSQMWRTGVYAPWPRWGTE